MNRRKFLSSLLLGAAALPVVLKTVRSAKGKINPARTLLDWLNDRRAELGHPTICCSGDAMEYFRQRLAAGLPFDYDMKCSERGLVHMVRGYSSFTLARYPWRYTPEGCAIHPALATVHGHIPNPAWEAAAQELAVAYVDHRKRIYCAVFDRATFELVPIDGHWTPIPATLGQD